MNNNYTIFNRLLGAARLNRSIINHIIGSFAPRRLISTRCSLCLGGQEADTLFCPACEKDLLIFADCQCYQCGVPLNYALDQAQDSMKPVYCGACLKSRPAYDQSCCPLIYQPPLDCLMWQFKFCHRFDIGDWFAQVLLARLQRQYSDENRLPDLIVPVPMTPVQLRQRGFNQSALLAQTIATRMALPIGFDLIARRGPHKKQHLLDYKARLTNLRKCFFVAEDTRAQIQGRHIAVVDDVITSGATAEVMARTLKAAGAERISIWAVARTPRD